MAHQWFGDYVTCKDWSHLWLNEGFATYYAHLYEGHKFGRDALLYGLYRDATGRGFSASAQDRRPIVYKEYGNASEQFDFRAYPKGSWVLHMLRSQLGPDLYRQCIKTYLERHALQSVETDDLIDVLEELSGQSLDAFFDQWVYHARYPDLKIRYRWLAERNLAELTVEQTQEVNDDVLIVSVSRRVCVSTWGMASTSLSITTSRSIVENRCSRRVAPPATARTIRSGYTLLAKVDFSKTDDMLRRQLANPHDVIGRLLAIGALKSREIQREPGSHA